GFRILHCCRHSLHSVTFDAFQNLESHPLHQNHHYKAKNYKSKMEKCIHSRQNQKVNDVITCNHHLLALELYCHFQALLILLLNECYSPHPTVSQYETISTTNEREVSLRK